MPVTLLKLLSTEAAGFTPIWPYIVGGVAAIVTVIIGSGRLYTTWRKSIEGEALKKEQNTRALEENTLAARNNSTAISDLTLRFDRFERLMDRIEKRLEVTDSRVTKLEARRSRRASPHPPEGEL